MADRAMKLENILLGVLLQHPSTGYDLKKYLDAAGRFLRSNTQMSQVYRSLAKMESDGWVRHEIEARPGAQDAKRYHVTAEGTTIFLDWIKGPYHPPSRFTNPDLVARLSFAGFMHESEIVRLLDIEIAARREEIARYRTHDRRLPRRPAIDFDVRVADIVDEWTHSSWLDAMVAHVDACTLLRDRVLHEAVDLRDGAELAPLHAERL